MLLSIITVNLNNKDGLERTAQSIVNQTCQDYEWIVIDGGSTDGSVDVIKKYAEHITYWVSEPDKGIYNAMNKGVAVANGDYLQFLNSGDWYASNDIISLLNDKKGSADVFYGNTEYINGNNEVVRIQNPPNNIGISDFLNENICQQSIFYNIRCFKHLLFNESYHICADYKFNVRLFLNNYLFQKIDRIITNYDTTGVSSTNIELSRAETIKCLNDTIPLSLMKEISELRDLRNFCKSDIISKTRDIVYSKKILRHLLRIFLYPIHFFGQITNVYSK